MGLESEWRADIVLRGTTQAPRVTGEIELVRGTLDFAGRSFELQEGRVTFPTGDAFDPAIRLIADDTIETVTVTRSEEHTSELQSLMRNSYAVFCLKQQITNKSNTKHTT